MAEKPLTIDQLAKVEEKMKTFMADKKSWVKRYGKDAEKVMRGRAINTVKKETENMNKQTLKELVRKALMQEQDIEAMADRIGGEETLGKASTMLDALESELKSHDWWYMMSDDNRAYQRGLSQQNQIRSIMNSLKSIGYEDEAKELYNQYAPSRLALKEENSSDENVDPAKEAEKRYKVTGLYDIARKERYAFVKGYEWRKEHPKEDAEAAAIAIYKPVGIYNMQGTFNTERRLVGAFVSGAKFAQLSLKEAAKFSKKYDDSSALKGKQKQLPDALQKSIIAKKKVKEAYGEEVESLALTFKDPNEFERAKQHFESNSDFYPFDISDEFKTFYFQVEDQADADSTEFYLNQELEGETDLQGYYFSTESSPLSEDLDLGHEDNEPHMIKGELYKIGKYAMELYQMVDSFEGKGEVDFPAWWQAKITQACSMISSAKHYLEFELKEPEIDAMVGVAQAEDVLSEVKVGDQVEIKKSYGGGKGKVTDKKGSFVTVNGKSYHESDVTIVKETVTEKKLTKAEKAKKEDIVKGMKGSFKGSKEAMYAIATDKAKKVAEAISNEYSEYSDSELFNNIKELMKKRARAASEGKNDIVEKISKEIIKINNELKKRS